MNEGIEKRDKPGESGDNSIIIPGGFKIKKKLLAGLFLFVFISLYLFQNTAFIHADRAPRDSNNQFGLSIVYYRHFFQPLERGMSPYDAPYPPLMHLTVQPFFRSLGRTENAARLSISIYTIILLLALFGIGCQYGGYCSGAAVMLLGASSPHILNLSRLYYLDFPQTALTALSFYLLLKTDEFKDRLYSILFALSLSLSFLAKWSTAFFMLVPILWFLIPWVIKSKRSMTAFGIFLIPAIYSAVGIILFFNGLKLPLPDLEFSRWFPAYAIIILIPAVICPALMLLLDRKWKKKEDYAVSGVDGVVNFSLMSWVFALAVFPFYFKIAGPVKARFIAETVDQVWVRHHGILAGYMGGFLSCLYNFAPLFMAGGLIFMMVKRGESFYRRLLLPVNIILVFLLMIKIGHADTRYFLSFVIFGAALGGYWTGLLKKARLPVIGFIALISLVSITAWTVIPGNLPLYRHIEAKTIYFYNLDRNLTHILCSGPPDGSDYDINSIIDVIKEKNTRPGWAKPVIFYTYNLDREPFGEDFIGNEAWQRGTNIRPVRLNSKEHDVKRIVEIVRRDGIENLNDIVILHARGESVEMLKETIQTAFPDRELKIKTMDIGSEKEATMIELR